MNLCVNSGPPIIYKLLNAVGLIVVRGSLGSVLVYLATVSLLGY